MQVTLVQTQIEQAIADYISARMPGATRDDMKIDLRATRGDEGYTAVVNVDPEHISVTKPAISTAMRQANEADIAAFDEMVESQAEEPDVQDQEEADAIEAEEAETTAEPEPEAEPETEQAPADPEPEAAEAEEAPKPVKRSIFADMKKPVNSKAEAA